MEKVTADMVFSKVASRQLTALMMHTDLSHLFCFLGLDGFSTMQEYRAADESKEYLKLNKHYLRHYHKLIKLEDVKPLSVIPHDWYKHNKFEVSAQVRKKAVLEAFDMWKEWETETAELYEQWAKALMDEGMLAASDYVTCLAEDTQKELAELSELYLSVKGVDADAVTVFDMQPWLCDKYKSMLKEFSLV